MARLQFTNAKTLHSWSGYGDGTLPVDTIIQRIAVNPAYETVKKNIISCDTLIIDEIGLISEKMFTSVEKICRTVKNSNLIFGGIQVIGGGSFFQLSPVPSLQDPGNYCFLSDKFWQTFPHTMKLTDVIRQREKKLIDAVNELCEGKPSLQTLRLVTSLSRPLESYMNAVFIFGTNFDVNFYNHVKVDELPGFQFIFDSEDSGEHMLLRRIAAPKYLCLKPYCKLIVIRNLDNGLVNGMSCKLVGLNDDDIDVEVEGDKYLHHQMSGRKFKLNRCKFLVRSQEGDVVASRIQFPVKLGYCITVDKAQGRTLDKLVVDGSNIWKAGQLGVAIGRAVSTEGLQVINFNKSTAFIKHPDCVYEAYSKTMKTIRQTGSCCRTPVQNYDVHTFAIHHYANNVQQLQDATEMSCDNNEDVTIHFPWVWDDFIQDSLTLGKTKTQQRRNQILVENSDKEPFVAFVHSLYDKVNGFFCKYRNPPQGSKCNWCRMCDELNMLLKSDEYISNVKRAFNVIKLSEEHMRVSASMAFTILDKVVATAKSMEIEQRKPMYEGVSDTRLRLTLDELNTLRYVAGACIHHLRRRFERAVEIDMLGDIHKAKRAYRCCQLVSCLTDSQVNLEQLSQCPETLIETIRRQGNKRSLKFVTDECFDFFKYLFKRVACIQNFVTFESRLHGIYGRNVETLKNDANLMHKWFNLFSKCDNKCSLPENTCADRDKPDDINDMLQYELDTALLLDMYDELCCYYIKVTLNELRKKYLDKNCLAPKTMQHRHEVMIDKVKRKQAKHIEYPCGKCCKECIDIVTCKNPKFEDFSVQCDKCSQWYHYICVGLTGKESFLKSNSNDEYMCPECITSGGSPTETIPIDTMSEDLHVVDTIQEAQLEEQEQNFQDMATAVLEEGVTRRKKKTKGKKCQSPVNSVSTEQVHDTESQDSVSLSLQSNKQPAKANKRKECKKSDERPLVTRSGRAVKKKVIHDA